MSNKRINILIAKYCVGLISEAEQEELKLWLEEDDDNQNVFQDYVEINYNIDQVVYSKSTEKAYSDMISSMDINPKKSTNYFSKILKYAAIFIAVVGLSYYYINPFMGSDAPNLTIEDEVITLELSDGAKETIETKGENIISNSRGKAIGIQKESLLSYMDSEQEAKDDSYSEKIIYNSLKVPYGKRFQIELSDGTKVLLNAGSTLKYPIQFIENDEKKVYLEGEAYFEVVKDENRPFIVNTSEIDVRVLGTTFNVSSYPEDENIVTVLVEGSVSTYERNSSGKNAQSILLQPEFKANWNKKTAAFAVESIDPELFTSWIHGALRIKNAPFKMIKRKIERKYNVTIINNNKKLDNLRFNMNFDIESIEEVLLILKESYKIDYNIVNNQIIIK